MLKSFTCCECGTAVVIPRSVKTVTCRRCGDVSFVTDGVVRRVYPALHMHPVTHPLPSPDYPYSKWMPTWTRPVRCGVYQCRFRHIEPSVIRLWWDGARFTVPFTNERIDMREFLTWRGVLA